MKAALLEGINKLRITNVPTPKCKQGEVLIKVGVCGMCRTDMKAYMYGQRDLRLPRIIGHEIAGTVVEMGEGVTQVKLGDRVQVAPGLPCGSCSYCLQGLHHMCDYVQIIGFHYDGGFAEYVLVPNNGVSCGVLNKIPEELSFQEAAITEPLACSINMQESLQVGLGDIVIIFGAGPLGILNAKLAVARGANKVILIEINENRLAIAKNREFHYCVNPLQTNSIKEVMEVTGGRGADVVIPCCPDPDVVGTGLAMLSKRGRFGFFSGLMMNFGSIKVDFNLIHYKELRVYGAYGCSSLHNRTAVEMLVTEKVKVKDMITRCIQLEEVISGIKMIADMKEMKIVINFE
jgi:L-iditol 2-dehydrogenase